MTKRKKTKKAELLIVLLALLLGSILSLAVVVFAILLSKGTLSLTNSNIKPSTKIISEKNSKQEKTTDKKQSVDEEINPPEKEDISSLAIVKDLFPAEDGWEISGNGSTPMNIGMFYIPLGSDYDSYYDTVIVELAKSGIDPGQQVNCDLYLVLNNEISLGTSFAYVFVSPDGRVIIHGTIKETIVDYMRVR